MNAISKKIPLFLALVFVWVLGCGFDNLEVETSAGIESVMADLTSEDFEALQIEDEWGEKVLGQCRGLCDGPSGAKCGFQGHWPDV